MINLVQSLLMINFVCFLLLEYSGVCMAKEFCGVFWSLRHEPNILDNIIYNIIIHLAVNNYRRDKKSYHSRRSTTIE